jgi:hypothetical protein
MMAIMHVPGHIFAPIAELGIANVMHIPCHQCKIRGAAEVDD